MDKTALAEKRRETVIGLLKNMTVRRDSESGFDKDDVYDCIQQLCNLYEMHIEELENNYETKIGEMSAKYQKYEENNDLYVSLIMDAKKTGNEIIAQAQKEVDTILEEGKAKLAAQEEEYNKLDGEYKKKMDSLEKELMAARDSVASEKASMTIELEEEKSRFEVARNRYRQQLEAMDAEFGEIKTNILRTAARLDGLKSQVENVEEEVQWRFEKSSSVEIPESDAGVEEIEIPETHEEPAELHVEPVLEVEPVPEIQEVPAEEKEKSFEETYFKSDILDSIEENTASGSDAPELAPEDLISEPSDSKLTDKDMEQLQSLLDARTEVVPEEAPAAETEPAAEVYEESGASIADMLDETPAFADIQTAPAEEPADVEEPVESVEELLGEISFDDILAEIPDTDDAEEGAAEISLDNLDAVEATEQEEISFEKLEEMFKDEK
ncbi:MAG: hypothetical protein ACI4LK_06805 [Lentihominibacter sp.]